MTDESSAGMTDESSDPGTGDQQSVQIDWSQLPETASLVQSPPSDVDSLKAALGVDDSQEQGSEA
jgi:hypothetical protein